MRMLHAACVDLSSISAKFSQDRTHRYSLLIPFCDKNGKEFINIIGQNPSDADEQKADRTVQYLERYISEKHSRYSGIQMLNLYSRVDKNKIESDVLDDNADKEFQEAVRKYPDVLIVVGKLKNKGAYKFKNRVKQLRAVLEKVNLYKFALDTDYAPHPGNRRIVYSNFDIDIKRCNFEDI